MGMYTELMMSARVKNDNPEVINVLKFMAGQLETQPPLPDHPLFNTPRWKWLFSSASYYFVPRSTVLFEYDDIGEYWVLISRADIKNYDDEIELFIDWIRPHLEASEETMIGYSRYEETKEPTIYYGLEQ